MPPSARTPQRAKRSGQLLLALIFCLILPFACADEAYDQGIDAFNRGDYEAAVTYFLTSRPEPADNATLYYNLGASYYKLARYPEARAAFLNVIADPEIAPIGYYNLALVDAKLNRSDQVAVWLQRTIESTDNPKLRTLALALLERYSTDREMDRADSAIPLSTTSPWSGFIVGETGYDSNVLLLADNQTLSTSDQDDFFLDAFGYVRRRLRSSGGIDMSMEGSAYITKYQDLDGYDIDTLSIGGLLENDIGEWSSSGRTQLIYSFLDGDEFTLEPRLNLSASRWLAAGRSRLRLRYEVSRINDLSPLYSYLSGWRHRTDARMSWLRGKRRLHLMYQFETNYREELSAPLFTSYSPVRNSLRFEAESPVGALFHATFEMRYSHSHYMNPNEQADGGFLTRNDDQLMAIARLSHAFPDGNELSFEYQRTENRSNTDDYDYTQYTAILGVLLSF
ncbi:MAG: tetratricopeptide repeat protein [Gammaproteobacteria bacterium]|nr:tetratricopeptide repeat protein [Gammaproteobacteria bacterium]